MRGKDGDTAVAMVEVYDLDKDADSELANISTCGFVQTGDDCMISGFIIDQSETARVLVRAVGKSLADSTVPVPNALQNPYLKLYDTDGNLVKSNNDWADTAEGEISATGLAPTDAKRVGDPGQSAWR